MRSATAIGATGRGQVLVTVRLVEPGPPAFEVAGAADDQLRALRDRIRAAVLNSKLRWTAHRAVVDLLPSPRPGEIDPALDLPIAMAFLAASQQIDVEFLDERTFIGTLHLGGAIEAVSNLPAIARGADTAEVVVPWSARAEVRSALSGTGVAVRSSHHLANLVGLRWGAHDRLNPSHEFDVYDEWDPYISVIERATEDCVETTDRLRRYFANAVAPGRSFFHETADDLLARVHHLVELGQELERAVGQCGADVEVEAGGRGELYAAPCTLPSGHVGGHGRPIDRTAGQRVLSGSRDAARKVLGISKQLGWLTLRADEAAATGRPLDTRDQQSFARIRSQLGQLAGALTQLSTAIEAFEQPAPPAEQEAPATAVDRLQARLDWLSSRNASPSIDLRP